MHKSSAHSFCKMQEKSLLKVNVLSDKTVCVQRTRCTSIPYSQPLSDSESKGIPLIKNSHETYQIYQNCETALQSYDTCALI